MKVRFHLPNFVNVFDTQLNYSLISMLESHPEWFRDGLAIGSVFDSFPLIWNGGRIVSGYLGDQAIEHSVPQILKMFNDKGVACRFTFSNPLLREEHLSDDRCNKVMELADNGMNGAIVYSGLLEGYLREHYPTIKLTSSTCKQIRDLEDIERELDRGYSLVVLDYNVNRDTELLGRISRKERCELLVNAICNPECPRRGEHYRYIGSYQLEHCNPGDAAMTGFANMDWVCENLKKDVFERRESPNYLTPEDIWDRLVPMGYRNFKIEGRGNPPIDLAEQYVYFMARPEHRDRVRYGLLSDVLALSMATRR